MRVKRLHDASRLQHCARVCGRRQQARRLCASDICDTHALKAAAGLFFYFFIFFHHTCSTARRSVGADMHVLSGCPSTAGALPKPMTRVDKLRAAMAPPLLGVTPSDLA
jgi:hypothetical protein